jgi:hypothetical protein
MMNSSPASLGTEKDFEPSAIREAILLGDLPTIIADLRTTDVSNELIRGLESLRYFRDHYRARFTSLSEAERGDIMAYDAEWSAAMIDLWQYEQGQHSLSPHEQGQHSLSPQHRNEK